MGYYSVPLETMKLCHLQENGGSGNHHVKGNKPD
jgi:hypothetical protein